MANKKTNYWFGNKRYGYGWVPSTWQGWTTVAVYFVVLIKAAWWLGEQGDAPSSEQMTTFYAVAALATLVLVLISYKKGPKPTWQWGRKRKR